MNFTRYGHVNQVFVKVGDTVKLGQKIATNGTGNGQWLAHLHRDHPKSVPDGNFGFYNIGWTKEKTLASFADPNTYPKALGDGYSHPGLVWLQYWNYGTDKAPKMCFHPGLDENGKGSGDADYDAPVYAVAEGIVRYVYAGTGSNGGWGRLIVIEEIINENIMIKEFIKALSELTGEDYGSNLNEKEQKYAAKKLNKAKEVIETLQKNNKDDLAGIVRVKEENEELRKTLGALYSENNNIEKELEKLEKEVLILRDNLRIQTEKAAEGIAVYGAIETLALAVKKMLGLQK